MSLNHPNASGNAGLKDLVQGLKWVQKNIANFGGNPKNVTVMGGSSGSAAVGYLVLSNLTTGSEDLFDLSAIDCSVGNKKYFRTLCGNIFCYQFLRIQNLLMITILQVSSMVRFL